MKSSSQALKAFCRFYNTHSTFATNKNWFDYRYGFNIQQMTTHICIWIHFAREQNIQINLDDATELAQNLIDSIKQ